MLLLFLLFFLPTFLGGKSKGGKITSLLLICKQKNIHEIKGEGEGQLLF